MASKDSPRNPPKFPYAKSAGNLSVSKNMVPTKSPNLEPVKGSTTGEKEYAVPRTRFPVQNWLSGKQSDIMQKAYSGDDERVPGIPYPAGNREKYAK